MGVHSTFAVAVVLTAIVVVVAGSSPVIFFQALADTWKQFRFAILTVALIVGLAYLFNYCGMAYICKISET